MGNPKQKWTSEEEEALCAVKWKNIERDPEFNHLLFSRSKIDLKDKWRNLSVANGQGSREKWKAPKTKANPAEAPATPLPVAQTSASIAPSTQDVSTNVVMVDSSRLLPEGNNAARSLPTFSLDNYKIWKFRLKSFLTAHHDMMWDVITNGPIIIKESTLTIGTEPGIDPTYTQTLKDKSKFMPEERKLSGLDNYAKYVISSTVSDNYVLKIENCLTAKEMWETLERMCKGSEEIREYKLTAACQKYNTFKLQQGESIDQMEIRFTNIINEIESLGKTYKSREMGLKILWALPSKWKVYSVVHQNRSDFNNLSHEQLFSILKVNEFDLNRSQEEADKEETEDEPSSSNKGVTFKANSKTQASVSRQSEDKRKELSKEEVLEQQYTLLARRFEKMDARMKKYRRLYKQNWEKRQSGSTSDRSNESYSSRRRELDSKQDANELRCYNCDKIGQYKKYCPDLSKNERQELRAKSDKRYAERRALLVDNDNKFRTHISQ